MLTCEVNENLPLIAMIGFKQQNIPDPNFRMNEQKFIRPSFPVLDSNVVEAENKSSLAEDLMGKIRSDLQGDNEAEMMEDLNKVLELISESKSKNKQNIKQNVEEGTVLYSIISVFQTDEFGLLLLDIFSHFIMNTNIMTSIFKIFSNVSYYSISFCEFLYQNNFFKTSIRNVTSEFLNISLSSLEIIANMLKYGGKGVRYKEKQFDRLIDECAQMINQFTCKYRHVHIIFEIFYLLVKYHFDEMSSAQTYTILDYSCMSLDDDYSEGDMLESIANLFLFLVENFKDSFIQFNSTYCLMDSIVEKLNSIKGGYTMYKFSLPALTAINYSMDLYKEPEGAINAAHQLSKDIYIYFYTVGEWDLIQQILEIVTKLLYLEDEAACCIGLDFLKYTDDFINLMKHHEFKIKESILNFVRSMILIRPSEVTSILINTRFIPYMRFCLDSPEEMLTPYLEILKVIMENVSEDDENFEEQLFSKNIISEMHQRIDELVDNNSIQTPSNMNAPEIAQLIFALCQEKFPDLME